METQQTNTTWMQQENEALQTSTPKDYEKLPTLKLEENKLVEMTIDFSKPFEKWTGDQSGKQVTKAIVPVTVGKEKKNFWLNTKNPLYRKIISLGAEGKATIKVLQTGNQNNTRYVLVE